MYEICSKLIIQKTERRDVILVSVMLIWTDLAYFTGVFIFDFEQANAAQVTITYNMLYNVSTWMSSIFW